jgi:CelD/BcsL family acetyltransferase involved in cellulose biosynthesis
VLAQHLLASRPQRITLAFVAPSGADVAEILRAATAARYRYLMRRLERSPYVAMDGGWTAYEMSLSRKVRSELRRRRRRLQEEGNLSFEFLDASEKLDQLLDEGFRVEAAGWKGERGSAIASQPATAHFYRSIARWGAERGWLRLGFLRLNKRALAFDFSFEHGGIHYLLKTGYDPGYARFAPGMLLRHRMIERAFADGLRSYEFLGADEPWKLEWATEMRERSLLQAFAPTPLGLVDWTANAYGRPLARFVRRLRFEASAGRRP